MVAVVDAAAVFYILNTTTSRPFHAAEEMRFQTFNCSAKSATEVSRIAVPVKFTIGALERTAAINRPQINHPVQQRNARAQQRKVRDVKTEQPIQMDVVITIDCIKTRY